MFTSEQKTQLAKLLATENLTVQHQKIRTAKFDPTNRVLYLPVWQNMSGSLYDLLVGHEVGHALYTPAEGWHDAVTGPNKEKNYKNFLNVVEDARIEKKVQRRYPGLKKHFAQAYKELTERDFFGTKGLDINKLSFIDRLNIFSKSQWTNASIEFSEEEQDFIKQVQSAETWDDVVKITRVIFDYSKEEQKEAKIEQFEEVMVDQGSEDDYDDYDSEYDDYDDSDGSDGDDEDENSSDDTHEDENESEENSIKSELNRFKESRSSWEDQFSPECLTDKNFREKEDALLDEKCKDVVYVSIPKPNLENIITPAKRVHELHDQYVEEFVAKQWMDPNISTKLFQEFKLRNERYVSLLAKEFEMRKAARAYNKSKVSDTGDIDINKLSSYKFDDNIFRKIVSVPKGKSHGLVLLLDKSGSMSDNMSGSIEQILVLTMFCRKVNIPFIVYGFGNSETVRFIDTGRSPSFVPASKCFEEKEGDVSISSVYLREYLNSKMSNVEFTRAMKHMLLIKKSFECGRYQRSEVPRFETEELSNTPLTETIIATAEIIKDFKRKNNLDITNLVIVHDGDADYIGRYYVGLNTEIEGRSFREYEFFNHSKTNYFLQDIKNKFVTKLNPEANNFHQRVMQWFTQTTDSKIFGFFICNSRSGIKNAIHERFFVEDDVPLSSLYRKNYFQYDLIVKKQMKLMKNEKFIETNYPGFKTFFLIAGGSELSIEDEEIEIEGKTTTKALVKAFMKYNKKKSVNRVLVSKFIQGIAV